MKKISILSFIRFEDKLKFLREQYNLSTKTIAEFLGMEEGQYIATENGNRVFDSEKLNKLCDLYGITMADFNNCRLDSRIPALIDANLGEQSVDILNDIAELNSMILSRNLIKNVVRARRIKNGKSR